MRWRLALIVLAAMLASAAGTVLAVAVNVATAGGARWFPSMESYPLGWTAGATAAVGCAGLLVWKAQRWYERELVSLVPAVQRVEPWMVERPAEVDQVVAALKRGAGETVGVTTAVQGAGGFGKTTVAKMVRADPRVLRHFRGRVYWVTLGRDTSSQALTGVVNGLINHLEPERSVAFTDARQAGEHLAAVVARGPRRLLILDDVWTPQQLAAFPVAGRCVRLVTTRIPSLTAGKDVPIRVGQMTEQQALALLLDGLPTLPVAVVSGLLRQTGRWALLLHLVNKLLFAQTGLHDDISVPAQRLLDRLRTGGALGIDELTGAAVRQLDVSDPDQRNRAVGATVEASIGLLASDEHARLAELAVFAEDETIPLPLIGILWKATGGLDTLAAEALVTRLADLALVTLKSSASGGIVTIHDVIRDYLRAELGPWNLTRLNAVLLDAAAAQLPDATPLDRAAAALPRAAWWLMGDANRYMHDHLVEHLSAAGCHDEAEAVACDLRWVGARLSRYGLAAPAADLAAVGSELAGRLHIVLNRAAHLLTPTQPPTAVIDVLHSRVLSDPHWGPQASALRNHYPLPRLMARWAPSDLPHPALRRTFTHGNAIKAMVVAPSGAWLATVGSRDGRVRIWDTVTWAELAAFTGHASGVSAVAIAADGAWLVSGGEDRVVRIWDTATWTELAALTGHAGEVTAVAIAPDGTWLATGGWDPAARIWDAATRRRRARLHGHVGGVFIGIAPDGTWLATADEEGVQIWDTATWLQREALTSHIGEVTAMVIAPKGTWLATAGQDGAVRIWDAATWTEFATLTGHVGEVIAMAVAPDGTWLATADRDRPARIWSTATWTENSAFTGHTGGVTAMTVAPDGAWLATANGDGVVRIWDTATWTESPAFSPHSGGVSAMVIASDGTWLATAGDSDRAVRIWEAATWTEYAALTGHAGGVTAIAIAPDGARFASADLDRTVRIWDVESSQLVTAVDHPGRVIAMAIAIDGSWLATASDSDSAARIWDTATWSQIAQLSGHTGAVTAIAIGPSGGVRLSRRFLISGCSGHAARLRRSMVSSS